MRHTFELKEISTRDEEAFSGPFDVLLSLLGEKKMDISGISLSRVTEQYIEHLNQIDEGRDEQLADFLVVATKLLLLKSRALLPQFGVEEEIDGPSLQDQLKLYKQFLDASKKIEVLWNSDLFSSFRVEPPQRPENFSPPDNLHKEGLHSCMLALVHRLEPPKPLPKAHIDRSVSVKEKINRVWILLKKKKNVQFRDVLESSESKTEMIVSFLALLELTKQKKVSLHQDHSFHDIMIKKV